MINLRRAINKSWFLAKLYYRWHGIELTGRPGDEVWYFAFGANMHDSAFRQRRAMRPLEWRAGRIASATDGSRSTGSAPLPI